MTSLLQSHLDRLAKLAYHRLEASGDLVRRFHGLSKKTKQHPDYAKLETLYQWLFVPITLWPADLDSCLRVAIKEVEERKGLSADMRLVIELLPPLPNEKAQAITAEHEHAVQLGNYESVIRAQFKFDQLESEQAQSAAFKTDWEAVKARFDVAKFQDHKKIIRRRLVPERSMRTDWGCDWSKRDERFQTIFDVFCQRWNLYGMEDNKPLLIKLTANLTPYGTMIFIPAYWSFDWKRDLNWKAITTMHRARGTSKQGPKLHANQLAKKREVERVRQLWLRAIRQGLKGEGRTSWILREMNWDSRTDERTLRRMFRSD